MAADSASYSLQLYRVVNPNGAVASDECMYGRNKVGDTIGVETVGTRILVFEIDS